MCVFFVLFFLELTHVYALWYMSFLKCKPKWLAARRKSVGELCVLREAHAKLTRDYQEGVTTRVLDNSQIISDFQAKQEKQDQLLKSARLETDQLSSACTNLRTELQASTLRCEALTAQNSALQTQATQLGATLHERDGEPNA